MKIHGSFMLQRRAMKNTDTTMNTVDEARMVYAATVWPLWGEMRKSSSPTEHFVSQMVMRYSISLA
jgi:hypothetical protein